MNSSDEAEAAVLGACLLNRKAASIAGELLEATDFSGVPRGLIFSAIQTVLGRVGQVDALSVLLELGDRATDCGGAPYINSLSSLCPAFTSVREYAAAVRDAAIKRRVIKVYEEVMSNGSKGQDALDALQEQLYEVDRPGVQGDTLTAGLQQLYEEAAHPTKGLCEFPWMELQLWTRGLRPGWLYYLAGETSHGKTAAALAIVEANIKHGRRVLFDSLEMSVDLLAMRIAQRHGLNSDRFYTGQPRSEDFELLVDLIGQEAWNNLRVESIPELPRLVAAVRRYKPDLVVVDYLGLMSIGSEARTEGTSRNSHGLKWEVARRFDIPVLCLCQISRDRTQRNRVPSLDRLKDSSSIDQDADVVLFTWRKRDDNDELTPEGTFTVAKSRMGRTGKVRFSFDGDKQTFEVISTHVVES